MAFCWVIWKTCWQGSLPSGLYCCKIKNGRNKRVERKWVTSDPNCHQHRDFYLCAGPKFGQGEAHLNEFLSAGRNLDSAQLQLAYIPRPVWLVYDFPVWVDPSPYLVHMCDGCSFIFWDDLFWNRLQSLEICLDKSLLINIQQAQLASSICTGGRHVCTRVPHLCSLVLTALFPTHPTFF